MATIKGIWKWNHELVRPDDNEVNWEGVKIKFQSNNEEFDAISLRQGTPYIVYLYNDIERVTVVPEINSGGGWDDYPQYQTIDFGETEKNIDDVLYTYIMANAIPCKLITGSWEFSNNLDPSFWTDIPQSYEVTFTSKGETFKGFLFEPGPTQYLVYAIEEFTYNGGIHVWSNYENPETNWIKKSYNTIHFEDSPQVIPEKLFNFISNCATPIISIQINSQEGITLATQDTIVTKDIKINIDPSLVTTSGFPIEIDNIEDLSVNNAQAGQIYIDSNHNLWRIVDS